MLWGGKPAEIIKAAESNRFIIFASEQIVGEISQVLTYPKLKNIYQAEGLQSEDLIEGILKVAKFVEVLEEIKVVKAHPADDKFIECASAAGVDYIVSGDNHLLKVACYKKTQIVSVTDFLQILNAKG
ncbi:MAG: putative toxin-antitoxin system toxin component, PIN family [Chloroflexi bacterium]|nr:putative toxin-antitoxin system toxin component, PIN family [Chloroflexota bacterium]